MEKDELGRKGEEIAFRLLRSKNYSVRARNWRYRSKEIDIIAEDKNQLVIVEVKTRTRRDFELPQDAVTKTKQRYLVTAANAYIQEHDVDLEARFDIVAIVIEKNKTSIQHIEDAFYPLV